MQGFEKSVFCYERPLPGTVESTKHFPHLLSAELTVVTPGDLRASEQAENLKRSMKLALHNQSWQGLWHDLPLWLLTLWSFA